MKFKLRMKVNHDMHDALSANSEQYVITFQQFHDKIESSLLYIVSFLLTVK